jgi:hypothetical protein
MFDNPIQPMPIFPYQEICDLTDRIVANVLNELISRKEDRICRVDYLKANEERGS